MKKYEGLNEAMVKHIAPQPGRRALLPPLSEKAKVALMCRMLLRKGWDEHIAGHITLRLSNGNILTNPWELAWDELTASDIVTLDSEGKILDSDWNVFPALGHIHLISNAPMHGYSQSPHIGAESGRICNGYHQFMTKRLHMYRVTYLFITSTKVALMMSMQPRR